MACLATVALLAGCGGPVDVDAPELTSAESSTCADLVAALPDTVDDLERRDTEPADAPAAAWGDPPVVLRCGVDMPPSFDDYATCQEVNGIGWYIPDEQVTGAPEAITMTTIGRDVNIEVALPEEHFPPANTMVDLSDAISSTTEELDPCV